MPTFDQHGSAICDQRLDTTQPAVSAAADHPDLDRIDADVLDATLLATASICAITISVGTGSRPHAERVLRGDRGDRGHRMTAEHRDRLDIGLNTGAAARIRPGNRQDMRGSCALCGARIGRISAWLPRGGRCERSPPQLGQISAIASTQARRRCIRTSRSSAPGPPADRARSVRNRGASPASGGFQFNKQRWPAQMRTSTDLADQPVVIVAFGHHADQRLGPRFADHQAAACRSVPARPRRSPP
jgi:hypothetical protein